MNELALFSGDDVLAERVREALRQLAADFELRRVTSAEGVIRDLNFEFPHVTVVNVDDPVVDGMGLLEEMKRDPWLHYGALIVVHAHTDEAIAAAAAKGLNLVALIPYDLVDTYLPRALRILRDNNQILYQRDIHLLLRAHHSGSFVLDNDPFDLLTYSRLLANFLFNFNLITDEQRDRFHVALIELLVNAVEHGNCGITYEEKSAYLAGHDNSLDLIRERIRDPAVGARRVYLSYRIAPEETVVTIRDEGAGFDWRAYRVATGEEGLDEMHGRGILMAQAYIDDLSYNDAGNEVTVGGRHVSVLTAADVFVGEMSFLLNNRRSATVTAASDGVLLRIDKDQFVQAIRTNPHYGILLARLLASRLVARLVALHHLPD